MSEAKGGNRSSRPLRLGIDGTELGAQPTGVGTYLGELLRRWSGREDVDAILYVRARAHVPAELHDSPNIEIACSESPLASRAIAWQQLALPRLTRKTTIDVLFAPAYSLPVLPGPWSLHTRNASKKPATVVALHDLSFERYPESFPTREGIRRRWLGRESASRATRVLTISESSVAEIEDLYRVQRERISVTPLGVAPDFADLGDLPEAELLREELGVGSPLVLSVGTLFNRRHPAEMIRAFALIQRELPEATLVLVGENRTVPRLDLETLVRDEQLEGSVRLVEHTPREQLRRLYKAADVFLYLSDYEGFGLPPLEALAGGTPTIVLDRSASSEYWTDHALALSEPRPDLVAGAIRELLREPTRGLRNHDELARRYDWDATAEQTLDVLRRAAAESREPTR